MAQYDPRKMQQASVEKERPELFGPLAGDAAYPKPSIPAELPPLSEMIESLDSRIAGLKELERRLTVIANAMCGSEDVNPTGDSKIPSHSGHVPHLAASLTDLSKQQSALEYQIFRMEPLILG